MATEELVVDVLRRRGDTLSQKIGDAIRERAVRKEVSPVQVLRQMRSERDHSRFNYYKLTLVYEPVEEEQLV